MVVPEHRDIGVRAEVLRKSGEDKQVLSFTTPGVHIESPDFAVELARMVKPTLVILDGTVSMVSNGPTGGSLSDLKETGAMIVSTDQVAADAYGAGLIGKTPADLPFIGMAAAAGVGSADASALDPIIVPEA